MLKTGIGIHSKLIHSVVATARERQRNAPFRTCRMARRGSPSDRLTGSYPRCYFTRHARANFKQPCHANQIGPEKRHYRQLQFQGCHFRTCRFLSNPACHLRAGRAKMIRQP